MAVGLGGCGLVAALVGCAGPGPVLAPADDSPMEVVIARVNRNNAGMDFLLKGAATVTGELVEPGGEREAFDLTGILYFRKPRNLYFQLKHTWDVAMEIGSNNEEFWLWKRAGEPRYWWGRHDEMGRVGETEIPLRPDHLLEVLGLGELPAETVGPDLPLFWVGSDYYELIFREEKPASRPYLARTVLVDRRAPFLVRSVVYFRRDGHPLMQAQLSEYRQIDGTAVLAPREIKIKWLGTGSRMDLKFTSMAPSDNDLVESRLLARSPLQRQEEGLGRVERVGGSLPPATLPSLLPASRPESATK